MAVEQLTPPPGITPPKHTLGTKALFNDHSESVMQIPSGMYDLTPEIKKEYEKRYLIVYLTGGYEVIGGADRKVQFDVHSEQVPNTGFFIPDERGYIKTAFRYRDGESEEGKSQNIPAQEKINGV